MAGHLPGWEVSIADVIQCPGHLNALKFLNILPYTKDHSKHLWITARINISLVKMISWLFSVGLKKKAA
jgi:hypothetical protein